MHQQDHNEEPPFIQNVKRKSTKKKKNKASLDPNFDKEKEKLKMFDPRGVQTLFRTLSRNHYNLLKMVDNKASIILTINSIIISLIMGAMYIAPDNVKLILQISARVLIFFSVTSMIFAVISMLPHRYFEKRYRDSNYKGSLYAGNFANQSLSEFQEEFNRITSNGHNVYDEMIKDLYFLGRVISKKQQMVWFSTIIFLIGLVTFALISFYFS